MIHDRARLATTRSAHEKFRHLSRAYWVSFCRATRPPRRGSLVEEPSQRRPVLPPLPTYCTHRQTPPVLTLEIEHCPKFQPHSSQWFSGEKQPGPTRGGVEGAGLGRVSAVFPKGRCHRRRRVKSAAFGGG
ncbi:unnamed protein product [Ectocarpus sp. 6 AP-2014]